MKNVKRINFIIFIVLVLVFGFLLCSIYFYGRVENNLNYIDISKNEEIQELTWRTIEADGSKAKVLLQIQNEIGIEQVRDLNIDEENEFIINAYGKTKLAIDYYMEDGKSYEFAVRYKNGEEKTLTVNYYLPRVTSISLDKEKATITLTRNTLSLGVTTLPSDAVNKELEWTSSNNSVATVSNSGVVKAKAVGKTIITCKAVDTGVSSTCEIEVLDGTLIYNRSDLAAIANNSVSQGGTNYIYGNYILMNDIDLSGSNWVPLGAGYNNVGAGSAYFAGTFNGNGYTIKNMKITANKDYVRTIF